MNKTIQPYLFFGGRCEEALQFYKQALGAEVQMIMRFKESPDTPPPGMIPPNYGEKVMHASFRVGDNELMASDGCGEDLSFKGFSLSITVPNPADVDKLFNALADGGKVDMPPKKTFWSPRFGMVTDKFGLSWMIGVLE